MANPPIKPSSAPKKRFGTNLGETDRGEATGFSIMTTFANFSLSIWSHETHFLKAFAIAQVVLLEQTPAVLFQVRQRHSIRIQT